MRTGLDNGPEDRLHGPAAGTITSFVKDMAKQNGFEDGVNGVTVEVHIPPTSGPFTGMLGHCEVKISCEQARYFSRVFGSKQAISLGARAVARGTDSTINNGIIVLNPTQRAHFQQAVAGP